MSIPLFYCLSTLLLFVIFFTYTSNYILKRRPQFIYKMQVEMVKTHLEQTYNLNTFQDSLHN